MKGSKFYTNRIKVVMVVDSVMRASFLVKLNITTTFEKSVQADVPLPQCEKQDIHQLSNLKHDVHQLSNLMNSEREKEGHNSNVDDCKPPQHAMRPWSTWKINIFYKALLKSHSKVFEPMRSTYVHFLVFLKKVPNSSEQVQNTAKKMQTFKAA